ncbi:MAG: hypothetical protein EBR40_11455 [Proteobacteria bacterium]|nr:hypothetical protein [Pseudomonadota bacterium]
MLSVDPVTVYVAELLAKREAADDGGPSIYDALLRAKRILNLPDVDDGDNEFPEEALEATTAFVEHLVNKISIEAATAWAHLLLLIKTIPDSGAERDRAIKKIQELAEVASAAAIHFVNISKPALQLVDYEHVTERVLAAGRQRVKGCSDDAQQPTDGPSDFQG